MQMSKILEQREVKPRAWVEGFTFDGSRDTSTGTGEKLENMDTSINVYWFCCGNMEKFLSGPKKGTNINWSFPGK